LRGVLRVVTIPENSSTDMLYHRPVPFHQHRERRLGLVGLPASKPVQHGSIGHAHRRPGAKQRIDMLRDR
jgi:hypothetical protein